MGSRRPTRSEYAALLLGAGYLVLMRLASQASRALATAVRERGWAEAIDAPDVSLTGLVGAVLVASCYLPLFFGGSLLGIAVLLGCVHGWAAADGRGRRGWLPILGLLFTLAGLIQWADGTMGPP